VAADPVALRIAGSTSMTTVLRELAAAYQVNHSDTTVVVHGGGTAGGLETLAAGRADIAAISWHAEDGGLPLKTRAVVVGRDAIALVVHPENPVQRITLLQLRGIYQGETLSWEALAGPASEPVVVSREDGSGSRSAFESMVMGDQRVTLNALVMPGSQAVIDYVSRHPAAIGYVSASALVEGVRALAVEEVMPTEADVRAGKYHLTRLLYLYAPEPAPPATQAFIDFVLSPAGQAIMARHHIALR
jgi:phosphate transport system substrate-binding protein